MGILGFKQASIGRTGVVVAPVPEGPPVKGNGPTAITSNSQLLPTARRSWPTLINQDYIIKNAYRPNALHEQFAVAIPANYGSETGRVRFGWRRAEYEPNDKITSIANLPGPVPEGHRPTYNNLVPILWRLTGVNQTPHKGNPSTTNANKVQYDNGGTASLGKTGAPVLT